MNDREPPDAFDSLRVVAAWLGTVVEKATWATSFAGLAGAGFNEIGHRYQFHSASVWLGSVGAVSLGACLGRLIDRRRSAVARSEGRRAEPPAPASIGRMRTPILAPPNVARRVSLPPASRGD